MELNKLYLMDCMDGMKSFPDNYFDLAIVDPPYGIGEDGGKFRGRKKDNYRRIVIHEKKDWDKVIPLKSYWDELFRISKNQAVFGGNYFSKYLPPSMGWVFWDKMIGGDFSDGELIWTSLKKALRIYRYSYHGDTKGGHTRIHPTQKPISVYKYCLKYCNAQPDFKIIDTHVGSGSSIIAFEDFGCDWIGFEIDEDYHKAATKRIEQHKSQTRMQL